jgi:type IV secretion system protein VirB10
MNIFKLGRREPDPDEENVIEGERELSSINKGLTRQNKVINWAVIVGLCGLAALLLYKYYARMFNNYQQSKAPTKDVTHTLTTSTLPPLALPDPVPVKVAAVASVDKLPPMQASASAIPASAPSNGQPPLKSFGQLVHERQLKAGVRFNFDGHTESAPAPGEGTASDTEFVYEPGAQSPDRVPGAGPASAAGPAFAKAIQPAQFAPSRAFMLPDTTLMITRGTVIPCTVLPAMDTTLAGIVSCITGRDAVGADNKVSLMDRGTKCIGKQGGGVTHGQRRVGIIWDRCETPQHVLVPLDAGATDALGRPGIPGQVDNHFWDRFGGAIALSLITDIGPYLVASKQGGGSNNTTVAFPTITGPQQIMSDVLRSTIDIPPTVYGPQGAPVLIYLAGDIDFRDVYQLERRK